MAQRTIQVVERQGSLRHLLDRITMVIYPRRNLIPVVLTLALILAAWLGNARSQTNRLGPPLGQVMGQDFQQVLRAAREIAAGQNPYVHALQYGRAPDFLAFLTTETSPYPYLPQTAVLALPLLQLPEGLVLVLWSYFSLVLVFLSAFLAVRLFTRASGMALVTRVVLIATLYFLYGQTQLELKIGQVDILIMFLLLVSYYLYTKGLASAGICLGLAISFKPLVGPMLLFFLWKRQWKAALTAAVTAGLLTVLGFTVIGWNRLPDYLEVSHLWATGPILVFPFNQSVYGFALRLFTSNNYIVPLVVMPWLPGVLYAATGLLAAGIWLVYARRSRPGQTPTDALEYGLTMTTLMWLWPLVEDIHFVWALIPLSALLLAVLDAFEESKGLLRLAIVSCITLYMSSPLLDAAIYAGCVSLYSNILVSTSKIPYTGAFLYGLLALYTVLVFHLWPKTVILPSHSQSSARA